MDPSVSRRGTCDRGIWTKSLAFAADAGRSCPSYATTLERTVNRDNTVSFQNLTLQIEPVRWRGTLAGCTVIVHQHLDGTLSLSYGPHSLGRYDERGGPIFNPKLATGKAVGD